MSFYSKKVKNSKKIKSEDEPKLLFKLSKTEVVQDFYVKSLKGANGTLNVYIGDDDDKTDFLLTTIVVEKGQIYYFRRGQISLKLDPGKAVYISSSNNKFAKKSLEFVFGLRTL